MKAITLSTLAAVMIAASSCTQLPDLNPSSNENIIVSDVMITENFNASSSFFIPLDINGNGTPDFKIIGGQYSTDEYGVTHYVVIQGLNEGNAVTRKPVFFEFSCGMQVENFPVQVLSGNFAVNAFTILDEVGAFYGHMVTPSGCENFKQHVTYGSDHYIGVRFQDEGETYYGWIQLKAEDNDPAGLSHSAELWTVKKCAYNSEPGQGLRIPQ